MRRNRPEWRWSNLAFFRRNFDRGAGCNHATPPRPVETKVKKFSGSGGITFWRALCRGFGKATGQNKPKEIAMTNEKSKKLTLERATLRNLTPEQLDAVYGGVVIVHAVHPEPK